jgi:hypothetical protein
MSHPKTCRVTDCVNQRARPGTLCADHLAAASQHQARQPLTDDEDLFLPVRKPVEARPMTDAEAAAEEEAAAADVAYFRKKFHAALERSQPKPSSP